MSQQVGRGNPENAQKAGKHPEPDLASSGQRLEMQQEREGRRIEGDLTVGDQNVALGCPELLAFVVREAPLSQPVEPDGRTETQDDPEPAVASHRG